MNELLPKELSRLTRTDLMIAILWRAFKPKLRAASCQLPGLSSHPPKAIATLRAEILNWHFMCLR